MPSPTTARPLTALVQAAGHPRILERLLAVLASRAYTLTGIRSFDLSDGSAPWLAMTMDGPPERADSLLARMSSLPHVLNLSRVHELDPERPPATAEPRVEQSPAGYRVHLGSQWEEAPTPELAAARLAAPDAATGVGVLVEPRGSGLRVIGCVSMNGPLLAMSATGSSVVAVTLEVFDGLARMQHARESSHAES